MPTDELDALFEIDRNWLSKQPGMRQWEKGCLNLRNRLEEILGKKDVPYRMTFLTRLWKCFSFHWQLAIEWNSTTQKFRKQVGFEKIYKSLLAGKGFEKRSDLGGNPLPCVQLAVAFVNKEEGAIYEFERDYRIFVEEIVDKRNWKLAKEDRFSDFWNVVNVRLGGFDGKSAKFNYYGGRAFLTRWLYWVMCNTFIPDYWNLINTKKTNKDGDNINVRYPVPIDCIDNYKWVFDTHEEKIEFDDDAEKLNRVIEHLLKEKLLNKRQKLFLDMFFKDRLSESEIAKIECVDSRTVAITLGAVIKKIKKYWNKIN